MRVVISIWALALALFCLCQVALAQPPDALERARQLDAEIVQHYRDGRYAEAIPLAREAVALREAALGPNHPDVGRSLGNLAQLLLATGDYAGARPLAERALRINEQAFGAMHPAVAASLGTLAALHHAMGDYGAARRLSERAVRITETVGFSACRKSTVFVRRSRCSSSNVRNSSVSIALISPRACQGSWPRASLRPRAGLQPGTHVVAQSRTHVVAILAREQRGWTQGGSRPRLQPPVCLVRGEPAQLDDLVSAGVPRDDGQRLPGEVERIGEQT